MLSFRVLNERYRENNKLEAGGIILLDVAELKDHSLYLVNVDDAHYLDGLKRDDPVAFYETRGAAAPRKDCRRAARVQTSGSWTTEQALRMACSKRSAWTRPPSTSGRRLEGDGGEVACWRGIP